MSNASFSLSSKDYINHTCIFNLPPLKEGLLWRRLSFKGDTNTYTHSIFNHLKRPVVTKFSSIKKL